MAQNRPPSTGMLTSTPGNADLPLTNSTQCHVHRQGASSAPEVCVFCSDPPAADAKLRSIPSALVNASGRSKRATDQFKCCTRKACLCMQCDGWVVLTPHTPPPKPGCAKRSCYKSGHYKEQFKNRLISLLPEAPAMSFAEDPTLCHACRRLKVWHTPLPADMLRAVGALPSSPLCISTIPPPTMCSSNAL